MGFLDFFGDQKGAYDRFDRRLMDQSNKYNPWIDRGNAAGQKAQGEYDWLVDDPNALQDEIAAGYEMSPYQQYLLNNTSRMINQNAANSGMITNPAIQAMLGNELNMQTGSFLNDYLDRGMNTYGQGLAGLGQTAQMGLGALDNQSNLVHEAAGGGLQGDKSRQGAWANLFGTGAGLALTAATGMPASAGADMNPMMQGLFGQKGMSGGNQGLPNGIPWAPTPANTNSSTFNWGRY